MRIAAACAGFADEKLAAPFGFKGKYINSLRQTAVRLDAENGLYGCGCGVQSVVWSDCAVFEKFPDDGGDNAMFSVTKHAAELAIGMSGQTPFDFFDALFPACMDYAKDLTGFQNLRPTFVLNALVPVDFALWQLYARQIGAKSFDTMIPTEYRSAFGERKSGISAFPLITYGMPDDTIIGLVKSGSFFLKIKIGSDPDRDGSREKMLAWDAARVLHIHEIVKDFRTESTDCGAPIYYLDANGRYDGKARLMSLLDRLECGGVLPRVALVEEPFDESDGTDVRDIPVRIAADESAHGVPEASQRISQGYTAMALKPIAKTMSVSTRVAAMAKRSGVPCFCADLTVNPLMASLNREFAQRLPLFPGLRVPVYESNGPQNYPDWQRMQSYMPANTLTDDSDYYLNLAAGKRQIKNRERLFNGEQKGKNRRYRRRRNRNKRAFSEPFGNSGLRARSRLRPAA